MKTKYSLLSVLAVFALINFAHVEPIFAKNIKLDMAQQLADMDTFIDATDILSPSQISDELKKIYTKIYNISTTDYDRAEMQKAGPCLIHVIFNLRTKLKNKIPMLMAQGKATSEVMGGIHSLIRVARFAEDMIGELVIGYDKSNSGSSKMKAFTGSDINTLRPFGATGPLDVRSGDVLLVRGNKYNSAAIARISDVSSQFSHAAIVYIDPQGKKWVIEALIETGLNLHTWDMVVSEGVGRITLLRYQDQEHPEQSEAIAARAGKIMYDRAVQGQKKQIDYDFSMEMDNYDRLFCSKVIRNAYDWATNGRVKLPQFPSGLDMKNREFFDALGISTHITIAPGDLELDPRFNVVAEWRDYEMTIELRIKDLILAKIFEWMDNDNMKFVPDLKIITLSKAAKYGTQHSKIIDALATKLVGKIPSYMKVETIAEMMMLQLTAGPLNKKLQQAEKDFIAQTGVAMAPRQMFQALETIRKSDSHVDYLHYAQ